MASTNKYKHFTREERRIIEKGISNGSTKTAIATTLGKDNSTVGKEIKLHRYISYKCSLGLECANYKNCKHGRNCKSDCLDYESFVCKRRDKSPGACNGCSKYQRCRFTKYKYDADIADNEYKTDLVETREGFNIEKEEVIRIGNILCPLLKQGQSLEQALSNHKEITITSRTIYTYIEEGLFKENGIDLTVLNLRRQVSRKISKVRKNNYKHREDRKFLKGRTYKDYCAYIEINVDAKIVQMDTVYNDVSNGPFIQTFKFLRYGFLLCIYHKEKTAESMNNGLLLVEEIIGKQLFSQEFEVCLSDRGTEFDKLVNLEVREDGTQRTRIFYCDPMASHQKGSLENKHEELRYICPHEANLYKLGLTSQTKMNLVTSNINSSPRKKLNWKSPIELLEFLNPDLLKKLYEFGIVKIDKDKVVLKPYLLKD